MSKIAQILQDESDPRYVLLEPGMETMIMEETDFQLRNFSAFEFVFSEEDRHQEWLHNLYDKLFKIATENSSKVRGVMVAVPTWRASLEHMASIGYKNGVEDVVEVNKKAIKIQRELVNRVATKHGVQDTLLLAGELGPRGDAYIVEKQMTPEQASEYHSTQLKVMVEEKLDVCIAYTIPSKNECIGIAIAAKEVGIPIIISPTIELDGNLPDGSSLQSVIEAVDAATDSYPVCFGVNCAHSSHLTPVIKRAAASEVTSPILHRLKLFKVNGSSRSHQELNDSPDIDHGDIEATSKETVHEIVKVTQCKFVGGCCGTTIEHIEKMAAYL
jgi:S-methylmethionine-dependent homocysteine/selenocysteine methylase